MHLRQAAAVVALVAFGACAVRADVIVNDATQGWYNDDLGSALDLTNPFGNTYLFPGLNYSTPYGWPGYTGGDPTINPAPAPDLSRVSGILGSWLTNPAALDPSHWVLQAIPSTWAVGSETALVYELNAGNGFAYQNTIARFGVDNGLFVYLDGQYQYGALAGGGASRWEYTVNLGNLSAGTHYLQVLREDHGGATGWTVQVDATRAQVPEPGTFALIAVGMAALAAGLHGRKRG